MTNTITINNKENVVIKEYNIPLSHTLDDVNSWMIDCFNIIKEEKFTHKGTERTQWQVRKPRGQRVYFVIQYSNGLFSSFA